MVENKPVNIYGWRECAYCPDVSENECIMCHKKSICNFCFVNDKKCNVCRFKKECVYCLKDASFRCLGDICEKEWPINQYFMCNKCYDKEKVCGICQIIRERKIIKVVPNFVIPYKFFSSVHFLTGIVCGFVLGLLTGIQK